VWLLLDLLVVGRVVIVIIDEGTVSGAGNSAAFVVDGPVAHAVLEFDAEAELELITDEGLRS